MSTSNPWGESTEFFYKLTPDVIDEVVRSFGLRPLGRVVQLNSLENRVYEVEVSKYTNDFLGPQNLNAVVIKFYRPGRWSEATIKEEHRFLFEMQEYEIPLITPLSRDEQSVFTHEASGLIYTVFPKVMGRLKDELNKDEAIQIGRLIARLHNIGKLSSFQSRARFNTTDWLLSGLGEIEAKEFISNDLKKSYSYLVNLIHQSITPYIERLPVQRIHGDFHRGNILWGEQGAWITDLDDCVMGPREQDLWLLFPGQDEWSRDLQKHFLSGYHEMSREPIHVTPFLTEALRSMRMIHFNAWIAKRWEDPIFQHMFTLFATQNYWEQQVIDLKQQVALLQDHLHSGMGLE
ncbi:MAG: serine/threonine protein kinase [Proteobacteria bacterium]|jgi:Ser/Thr protein kinase RdoA (MazF antagonist)|nr:serine/threonine protein kinase [Pseudomonadota bacterium]